MKKATARILEVGPYPPPLAGWSIRIRFVRERINELGHDCRVLNIGKTRKIPSDEYLTCCNFFDYLWKCFRHAVVGFTMHPHTNGKGPVGIALALIASAIGCLCFRRVVLSFHAGLEQVYFPRERSGYLLPFMFLLFKLPRTVLCDNEAIREKIVEFGISPDKVVAIRTFGTRYIRSQEVALPEHVEQYVQQHDPLLYTYFFFREGFHLETLIRGLQLLVEKYPRIGIINASSIDDFEPPVKQRIEQLIEVEGVSENILLADDLSHDEFLTLARRSKLFLRTPTSDGESASVLEALASGVPVVASENQARPESVITYRHDNPQDLCQKVTQVLENHREYCDKVVSPTAHDTIEEEAQLLIRENLGARSVEALSSISPPAPLPTAAESSNFDPTPSASSDA